ncbi:uncharacterized protein TRIVIDRAFT_62208 [Trichoderma virens Gv29-8]|uniref:PGG domain-containing protein n=1 Tax=Hypocrea virens (strain Gv29-8 / FGSC 10586) TaxID=413071 RepID=G9MJ69_HYPVG|nr:uncharacterized protein TRIVIDRAFT_62208 [Trichoderma virens Gv29-8]EHK25532.1 hypothetical protein TRIVIDRAFT_62208 [Trichoderma virens Gv29-8]
MLSIRSTHYGGWLSLCQEIDFTPRKLRLNFQRPEKEPGIAFGVMVVADSYWWICMYLGCTELSVINPQVANPGTNSGSTIGGNQAENESSTIDTDQLSRINQILSEGFASLNTGPSATHLYSTVLQTNQILRAIFSKAESQMHSDLVNLKKILNDADPKGSLKIFCTNVGAISTLGSSVTFALIVSQLQDPTEVSKAHHFDLSTVRIFISISWLLFTITLVLSIFLGVLDAHGRLSDDSIRKYLALIIIYLLNIGAFTFLALTVAAYVDTNVLAQVDREDTAYSGQRVIFQNDFLS